LLKVLLSVGALQVAAMLVLILRTKGLALQLGPELYALMGVLDRMVQVFAQTASLSLPVAAIRFLSPLREADPVRFFWLFRRMRNVLVFFSLLATIVGLGVLGFAPGLLGEQVQAHRGLAALALLGLPAFSLVPFIKSVLAASAEHSQAMLVSLYHAILLTLTAVVGVWVKGLDAYFILYAVSCSVMSVWLIRRLARATPSAALPAELPRNRYPAYLPSHIWRYGLFLLLPAFFASYVAYFVFERLIAVDGRVIGGYMQSAMGIGLAVRGVLGSAGMVFLAPLVNRPGNFLERVKRADDFQKTLFMLVGVLVPPLILFSELVLILLYSRGFAPAAPYVVLFVGVEILGLAVGNYQAVLLAMDEIGASVVQNVIAQATLMLITVLTVPRWGIIGVGVASIASQLVLLLGTVGFLARRHGFKPHPRVVLVSAYVLLLLAGSALVARSFPGLQLRELAIKLGAYLVMVTGLAVFLDRQDWQNIGRLRAALQRRRAGGQRRGD
jgi:O-antigen/teichoic acid export membrane protein